MKARVSATSLLLASLVLGGCTSTEFLRYEGRSDVYFEGTGGARTVVNGVDFWEQGTPPRRYQLIGYIKDDRHGGIIPQMQKQGDIAAKAKASGGDAVMLVQAGETLNGYVSSGTGTATSTTRKNSAGNGSTTTTNASASSVSVPVGRTNAQYAVLKYLD